MRRRARAARRGPCARRAAARRAAAIRQATIANRNAACSPSRNGPEMRLGKNELAGERRLVVRREPGEHVRAEQVLDRVVAEEGGEQDRHRRQRRPRDGRSRRSTPCACRPALIVSGSVEASPMIISVKKIPIDSTWAEFWKVWFIAPPAPRSLLRQAVHHRRAVGRGEHAHRRADQQQDRAEDRVGEVGRQQHQQARSRPPSRTMPARRERARAEAVGQVARGRPGAQHPDGQRQHVDARPQRRLGEVVAVLGQPDALQPDDEHEHQAAAGDGGQERRQRAEGEGADAEQRQAEHRVGHAALDDHEGDEADHRAGEQGEHARAAPADRHGRRPGRMP